MEITGAHFLGSNRSKEGPDSFQSLSPSTNEANGDVSFAEATAPEISEAVSLAAQAFETYRRTGRENRASFLEAIAANIEGLGDQLIQVCMEETALPEARLIGERGRTANQLRLFAAVVREGSWVDARIDTAIPDRKPLPKPDVRSMSTALGPVAVFGASNFPLAFSVAGGDTASALAAGCPVVFKAHPAHPRTCEMVAQAIITAAQHTQMPNGAFSLVHGQSHAVGSQLVEHSSIKAVAFTGSQRGGLALFQLAHARKEPIPVFAEMGSTNPVFILPEAMATNTDALANGLAASVNLGVGQFCTNPGLVFATRQEASSSFVDRLSSAFTGLGAGTMLTGGIANSYQQGSAALKETGGVSELAAGAAGDSANAAQPHIFETDTDHLKQSPEIMEELFGPSTVLIHADTHEQLLEAARNLEGQLTATLHGTEDDLLQNQDLIAILEQKVGRLIINGYSTGVEVCHSMVHGGPYPATTAPSTTSVGTLAIKRFVRPLCYQDFPEALLPEALRNSNPLGIHRMVDGEMTRETIS